jgi:hypothetical protein
MRRWLLAVVVALPAVLAALAGLAHPVFLTAETAERWRLVHLVLLPLFPLVGASVWLLLLGLRGALAWLARGLALGYALLYTALDSIAGIGAGHQVLRTAGREDPRPPIEDLFAVADPLGAAGVLALAAALALTAVVLGSGGRSRVALLGGLLAVGCCHPFLRHHVFPPRGVLAMLGLAAGLALLALARAEHPSGPWSRRRGPSAPAVRAR